jgi:uncharacterized membrane protein YGL010W
MSPALQKHFADYASFHTTSGNKTCHALGIPIIVLSTLALLGQVPLVVLGGFTVTVAEVAIAAATAYYLRLDAALAGLMLAAYALLDALGRFIPPAPALGLFVFGWILQGVGHYVYEKKSPAFFRNLAHLAVGQLWILAKAVGRA